MKKNILFHILLIFLFIGANAQHTWMVYPVASFRKVARVGYEYHSENSRLSYGTMVSGYFQETENKYMGFDISPYVKIFINKQKIPNTWYFQPKLIAGYLNAQELYSYSTAASEAEQSFNIDFPFYGVGLLIGKQWVLKNGLTFTLDVGAKYVYRNIPDSFTQDGHVYDQHPQAFSLGPSAWYIGPGCPLDGHFGIGYTFPYKK